MTHKIRLLQIIVLQSVFRLSEETLNAIGGALFRFR